MAISKKKVPTKAAYEAAMEVVKQYRLANGMAYEPERIFHKRDYEPTKQLPWVVPVPGGFWELCTPEGFRIPYQTGLTIKEDCDEPLTATISIRVRLGVV